jgi:hypothetical protein
VTILKLIALSSFGSGSVAALLCSDLGPDIALIALSMFF